MGFWAIAAPIIGGIISGVLSKPKTPKTPIELRRSASAEAAILEQQKRYRDLLFNAIQTLGSNPRPDYFEFGKDNPEDLYNSLSPTAGLNALFQLAGLGSLGTGATQQMAQLGQRQSEISGATQAALASDVSALLTEWLKNRNTTNQASQAAGQAAASLYTGPQPTGTTPYGDTGF